MYDTLRPELITASAKERRLMAMDPTFVVSWDIFSQNPFPYLEVRRPFILGTAQTKWKATIAHRFFELLHTKTNKLTRIYTQNIDGLDRQCDKIPAEKIVPVHGSLSRVACEACGNPMEFDDFCQEVRTKIKDIYKVDPDAPAESSHIPCPACQAPQVKPTTVLFGRALPNEFFESLKEDMPVIDLLIVAGTSLVVSPANSLVYRVPKNAHRVVVNLEKVGEDLGIQYNDHRDSRDWFLQGTCDKIFLDLIKELGWIDNLNISDLPEASANLVRQVRKANNK
jgi:NAD-dependent SIR2 family protein deacetylase